MKRGLFSLAVVVLIALTIGSQIALADASWLVPPLGTWNLSGMALPQGDPYDSPYPGSCIPPDRTPQTAAESAVRGAGWVLYDESKNGFGIEIVDGRETYDGMCRPGGFQSFVFVNGVFAGTLSPIKMYSRTNGDMFGVRILDDSTITARVAQFGARDALCCPSKIWTVTYTIDYVGGLPVVNPRTAY